MTASPTTWTLSETPSTGARRLVQPPPKSPEPNATADARPRTTTARFAPAASAPGRDSTRRGRGLRAAIAGAVQRVAAVVQLRRAGERDDRIGRGVVPV